MAVRLIVEPQAAAIAARSASLSDLQAIADAHHHAQGRLRPEQLTSTSLRHASRLPEQC
jgi:DNA-binding FadR family transcriptional regulator